MQFENLDSKTRADICNNRVETDLVVNKTTVDISNLDSFLASFNSASHVELPPTPLALMDKSAAEIIVHSGEGFRGAWNRFFILVYRNNGKILFKVLNQDQYEVLVRFTPQN